MNADWTKKVASAAAAGLLAACASSAQNTKPDPAAAVDRAKRAEAGADDELDDAPEQGATDRECCRGLHECRGKGGCKVDGQHDCQGMNDCKGQGGCNAHCPDA